MLSIPKMYFLAVADTKSFSRAAEKLFVTQPAVSKQISLLEEELGFALFERTTRTVHLTSRGKIIYKVMREVQNIWEEAVGLARSTEENVYGELRVGLLHGWSIKRLNTKVFEVFQRKYPDVELVIEKHTYRTMTAKLLDGSLDIIFCPYEEISAIPTIQYWHAFTIPLIVLLSSTHPVALHAKTLDDFPEMDIFVMNKEASLVTQPLVERLIAESKWKFHVKQYPNFESILLSVERNQGCAMTSLASSACDSQAYKYYLAGTDLKVECAWNIQTSRSSTRAFLSEICRDPLLAK